MWKTVNSSVKPALIDTASSKVYSYARRNIVETETGYTYEEAKVPKAIWEIFQDGEQTKADIAYVAMMADIDLEEG